jgi:hypothetical protein
LDGPKPSARSGSFDVNLRTIAGRVFHALREAFDIAAMITDPDQVNRTLGVFEKELKRGSVVHD